MLSIYPEVSWIYNLHRPLCLHYPWISVHIPSLLNDILGDCDRATVELDLEVEIEWNEGCTLRLWSSEFEGVLAGSRFEGRRHSRWVSIHGLTYNFRNAASSVQHPPRDEKLAGSCRLSILGWCYTGCILYSVSTENYGKVGLEGMT